MTSYLHVLNTYAWRWRFWIFGGLYVLVGWLVASQWRTRFHDPIASIRALDQVRIILLSTIIASLIMAFLALHVRRQFGSPQAHLTPGFFGPHFAIFVAASLLVWMVVPCLLALQSSSPVLPFVSGHALAAILLGLVVVWPGAMVLLVAMFFVPVLLFGKVGFISRAAQVRFAEDFAGGQLGGLYFALLTLAAAAYVAAAWRLGRLSDLSAASSDDFSLEIKPDAYTNPVGLALLQTWRDRATDNRLLARQRATDSVGLRWIPRATSWPEIALVTLLMFGLTPAAWYLFRGPDAAIFMLTVGSAVMIFAPLSAWRFRLNALVPEVTKPATRREAIRRIVLAMALDFIMWGVAASLVVACGYVLMIGQRGFFYQPVVISHLLGLWGAVGLIFGVTLATMRFRYWVPLFIGLLLGIVILCALFALILATVTVHSRILALVDMAYSPFPFTGQTLRDDVRHATHASIICAVSCAAVGLILSRYSYRRLLEADLR